MADLNVRSGIHEKEFSPLDGFEEKRGLRPRTLVLSLVLIVVSLFTCYRFGVFDETIPAQALVAVEQVATPTPVSVAPQPSPLVVTEEPASSVAPSPTLIEKSYVVQKGDTLSRKFPKDWKAVCETNSLKSCGLISEGLELKLPGTVETSQVVRKPVERLADGSLPIARLNIDPYRPYASAANDRKILAVQGYSAAEIEEFSTLVAQGGCVEETFAKGTQFPWMSHGNAKVVKSLVATWQKPEAGRVCQLSSGRTVVILEKCGNLTETAARRVVPKEPEPLVESEPESDDAPVLPVHAKEGDVIPCNLQAGAGVYQNHVYQGAWGYGEGLCYIFKNGEWQHGPGFYAMAGGGESRMSTYSNKETGYGLQYGIQRNWLGDRGPATFELKGRLLRDHMWGSNKEGYWVDQKGYKFGLYGSYYERHGENLVGAIGEYWQSFGQTVKSPWSGQQAQNRGSVGVYGVYEHPLDEKGDWRLRWIAGVNYTNWDEQSWFRVTPEFRYKEWLMFGPQLSVPIGISSLNQPLTTGDLTTVGAFVRVELGTEIRKADAENREEQVEYVPAAEVAIPIHPATLIEAPPAEAVAPAE